MTAGNLGAAAAAARMEEKMRFAVKNLCVVVVMLLVLTITMSMYRMPGYPVPPFGGPSTDFSFACLFFALVTMQAQFILAHFLAGPAPPTTRDRWMLGTLIWLFVSAYFMSYAHTVAVHAPNTDPCELLVAAMVASTVNLAISLYIVLRPPSLYGED